MELVSSLLLIFTLLIYVQAEFEKEERVRKRPFPNNDDIDDDDSPENYSPGFRKSALGRKENTKLSYVKETRPLLNLTTLTNTETEKLKPSIDFEPPGKEPQHNLAGRSPVAVSNQILNGTAAAKNQFPWQVAIIQDGSYFCGGSVITRISVLTAGHCCYRRRIFDLYFGTNNHKNILERISFRSTLKFIHGGYSPLTLNNDVCVIKLNGQGIAEADITSGKVRPIRLPSRSQALNPLIGYNVTATGWGKTTDTSGISETLNFVHLTTISNIQCAKSYGTRVVISSVLCTSGAEFKGICSGDSGGPLVMMENDQKYTQVGIVSFGASVSCSNNPSGYTRVPSILGWISQTCSVAIRL